MLRSHPARHTALIVTALLVSAGCSSLPTSPDLASRSASGAVASEGSAPQPELLPEPPPIPVSDPPPAPGPVQSAQSMKMIHGGLGGTVSAGNFTVVIPPLAIRGVATVTVRQPDVTKPYVSLHIWPKSANNFQVPVILVADASPMESVNLSMAVISWFNPATGKWEPMVASSINLIDRTVLCPLSHFSEYAVEVDGKAGW